MSELKEILLKRLNKNEVDSILSYLIICNNCKKLIHDDVFIKGYITGPHFERITLFSYRNYDVQKYIYNKNNLMHFIDDWALKDGTHISRQKLIFRNNKLNGEYIVKANHYGEDRDDPYGMTQEIIDNESLTNILSLHQDNITCSLKCMKEYKHKTKNMGWLNKSVESSENKLYNELYKLVY